jgi:2-polyprenyl-6-methoxyphenol hydroxylase-like FAD-dependent oxidoreductase
MRVIVVGGGIGGLTAALCLHAAGHQVRVYEAVGEIRALGVGINVQPSAIRILSKLGLVDDLDKVAIRTAELVFANRHGQPIWRDPRGLDGGYPWPQFSIHRGDLQMALLNAATARLGADNIRPSHRLARFEQTTGKVTAHFIDRDGKPGGSDDADILIGADGIHSTVRSTFYPHEGPPRWQGVMMWRGVSEGMPFLSGRSMVQAGYHRQKFVCYPISRRHAEGGKALINWIADLYLGDGTTPPREDWNKPGDPNDILPKFSGWNFGWLDVPTIIRTASAIFEFPMVDRDPLPRWSHNRVTLLGDAAHPMYPIGSNGATQAIIDGEALTIALSEERDPIAALKLYESRRLPPTARIVESNRKHGLDRVLDIVEERAPDGFTDIEKVLPAAELESIVGDYKRMALYDKESLLKLAAQG